MERYSKWRVRTIVGIPRSNLTTSSLQDAGTGISPFVPLVAPSDSSLQLAVYKVLANVVAVIKTVGLVLIGAVYAVLVGLPSTLLVSFEPIRTASRISVLIKTAVQGWNSALTPVILEPLSTLLLRFLLLVMGYVNISSEVVSTKRGSVRVVIESTTSMSKFLPYRSQTDDIEPRHQADQRRPHRGKLDVVYRDHLPRIPVSTFAGTRLPRPQTNLSSTCREQLQSHLCLARSCTSSPGS